MASGQLVKKRFFDKLVDGGASSPATTTPTTICLNCFAILVTNCARKRFFFQKNQLPWSPFMPPTTIFQVTFGFSTVWPRHVKCGGFTYPLICSMRNAKCLKRAVSLPPLFSLLAHQSHKAGTAVWTIRARTVSTIFIGLFRFKIDRRARLVGQHQILRREFHPNGSKGVSKHPEKRLLMNDGKIVQGARTHA